MIETTPKLNKIIKKATEKALSKCKITLNESSKEVIRPLFEVFFKQLDHELNIKYKREYRRRDAKKTTQES